MKNKRPTQGKILVVDDEPAICGLVAQVLKTEGYQPIICHHPNDALIVSEREALGLAFVDINLPHMNGLELAAKLKGHDPRREVVFITGYGTFDNAIQAIRIGAYDYLRKPFSVSEISLCLKRFQDREKLKEHIRLAEQRYFHLVQNIPMIIFVLKSDFNLEFINNACSMILGYSPVEAMNVPEWLLKSIYPEDREHLRKKFKASFRVDPLPFSVECRFTHKKGHVVYTILKSIPGSDHKPGHTIDRLEGIIVDITDRVFLEKALVQREKLKTLGAISAEVAHEIRNPLVSIGGFARRLQSRFPELPECGVILTESMRLEKILDRIRNYLKPVELCHQECSVNSVLTYCMDLLFPELEMRNGLFELHLAHGLSSVYTDPEILTQIFINLIRNAVNAMDRQGALTIETFERDQNVYIDFKNLMTGPMVKDPELLFLPFDEGGQSIGLPLCYRLLRKMGGMLTFNQREDTLVFTVSLPKDMNRAHADG